MAASTTSPESTLRCKHVSGAALGSRSIHRCRARLSVCNRLFCVAPVPNDELHRATCTILESLQNDSTSLNGTPSRADSSGELTETKFQISPLLCDRFSSADARATNICATASKLILRFLRKGRRANAFRILSMFITHIAREVLRHHVFRLRFGISRCMLCCTSGLGGKRLRGQGS